MKVQKGLATYAGLVAALGQYMAAVAVFLEADDQSVALGPLVTATVTLLAVIVGRMQQAKAQIQKDRSSWGGSITGDAATLNRALAGVTSGTIGGRVGRAFKPEPLTVQQLGQKAAAAGLVTSSSGASHVHQTRALGEPIDLSIEIPGGGFPQDGERA
jgi:hypothetical protein